MESEMITKIVSSLGGVPRFVIGTLTPKDLIDWIVWLEDYFEHEDIADLLRVRLA